MHTFIMNKTMVLICLFIISGFMGLTGCTDFFGDIGQEDKVVPVTVIADAFVRTSNGTAVEGVDLQFDFSKTNGQDFRSYRVTNEYGSALVNQYSYNLHKGQTIRVTCKLTSELMIQEQTVGYDELVKDMETHATTAWYPSFDFTLDT